MSYTATRLQCASAHSDSHFDLAAKLLPGACVLLLLQLVTLPWRRVVVAQSVGGADQRLFRPPAAAAAELHEAASPPPRSTTSSRVSDTVHSHAALQFTHTHTRSVYSLPASQRDPSTPSTVKKSKRSIIAV